MRPTFPMDLAAALEQHVAQRTWGRLRGLAVDTYDGRVTIRGQSRSYYHKQLAIQACLEVLGPFAAQVRFQIDVQAADPALVMS